jgi:hypothetical protein
MKAAGRQPVTKDSAAYCVIDFPTSEPAYLDWLLYLSHMHRTGVIRARQRTHARIWLIVVGRNRARSILP